MSDLNLAVIGNCTFSAILDRKAQIVWSCLPKFDADPVFSSLVDEHNNEEAGLFDFQLEGQVESEQRYRPNTAIVETTLFDDKGGALEIIDFAPRFKQKGRVFRPISLVRIIRPVTGSPRLRVRLRPRFGYGKIEPDVTRGSNHIRYVGPDLTLRLTTDCPVSYVQQEIPFILERPMTFILGPDESLPEGIDITGRKFLEETDHYWREWTRYLSIPFEWQDAVIRAAITLKMSSFEETGAIVAAMTTSIPEAEGTQRTWDYRYCWLRDSFFVVRSLNRLGVTRTLEGYLEYITNIIAASEDGYLQPLYGILQERVLEEHIVEGLTGYDGGGNVRVGNQAYKQVQNDGYGSVILSVAQSFFDQRLDKRGDIHLFEHLERLGRQAVARWDQPDAGLWEYRTREDVHTFSSIMCWAACDRLSRIAQQLSITKRAKEWAKQAKKIKQGIQERAWNEKYGAYAATFGGDGADASMLLMADLGFVAGDSKEFAGTVALIEKELKKGDYLFRYSRPDDFGHPETSFNICTFWYIDALVYQGRYEEARELFDRMLTRRNHVGLLSEDIDTETGQLWGNFPQTYSMVGLIQSALRLSKPWEDAF